MSSIESMSVEERIGRAREVLEARLDEDVPLEELAAAACYSMFHFHRLFRGVTGETVREQSRRLRLERAAHRLVQSDDDILPIALAAGYESHEAFTRAFKARFGETPSAHRALGKAVRSQVMETKEVRAMDVMIRKREPVRIAYARHVGPYDEVGAAWQTLMKWGWTKMMFGKAETFGLCFDDPEVTPRDRIRYDACMVVNAKAKPKGEVQVRELEGGTFAMALHSGGYKRIGDTYARLFARVASGPIEGRTWGLGDPPTMEVYLNDPRKTKAEDLRTEVMVRVEG